MGPLEPVLHVWNKFCDFLSRQLRYLINLKKNFEQLTEKVELLHARVEDVNRKISGKKPTSECQHWLNKAEKIQIDWKEIEEEYQKNRPCLVRWCPNILYSRLKLAKRIEEWIPKTDQTIENLVWKHGMVMDEPPQIMPMPTPRVLEGNTSADQTLQELLASIKKPSVNRIGLWGMGGVGKTRIMKLLNNLPEMSQIFEIILWVTVSMEWTNRKLLKDLAERLELQIKDGESIDSLKSKVFTKLKAMKFLLLLDDVWSMIELEEVGVPALDEGKTGCKVVLSTRDRLVCNRMSTDEEINVKTLSPEEAWSLFRNGVGEVADDLRIKELAREVVMECDGLPLAIIVIAGTLRKETDIRVWKHALNELRLAGKIKDMESRVYQRLKYSYDRLEDDSKKCFLYCALFPEDWEIWKIELIQYWINEGLIDGCSNLEEAKNKGFAKLKELIDASMLEEGSFDNFVKMHDMMRDLALRISSVGEKVLVKAGAKLSESPKLEDWEKAKRISLMKNDLKTLPQMSPYCGRLITLLLQENYKLKEIPSNFFEHMSALKVLNLSGTLIGSLPSSINSLANLQGLYLNRCHRLKDIPKQVRGLVKLGIFQMRGSNKVCYLPAEIGELTFIKQFEVQCGTTEAEELEQKKIFHRLSNLSSLERLGLAGNKKFATWWDSDGVRKDLSKLSNLTHLLFTFSKIEHFESFVQQSSSSWKNDSITFRLLIGQQDSGSKFGLDWNKFIYHDSQRRPGIYSLKDESRKMILYNDCTGKTMSDEILTRVDTLAVSVTVQSLSEFGWEKMNELKYCFVLGCDCIETITFIDNGKKNSAFLGNLQELSLYKLPNLKSICEGSSQRRYFTSLTVLEVSRCNSLKVVLSSSLIPHLSSLKQLKVRSCKEVEEIISMDDEEGGEEIVPDIQTSLLRLKFLYLSDLPKLRSICSKKEHSAATGWRSLEQVSIYNCDNLKSLPRGFSKAPNLEVMQCPSGWFDALEWEDDALKQQFCFKVTIQSSRGHLKEEEYKKVKLKNI